MLILLARQFYPVKTNRPFIWVPQSGLTFKDAVSKSNSMHPSTLTWPLVDDTAKALGAKAATRFKWRQRGVPSKWRIDIAQELMRRGIPVALPDFDRLELTPGRIAA